MHAKRIMARIFRRFADLEITPATAKLVLVAGPNGYGKSSLFDIFLRYKYRRIGFHGWLVPYHARLAASDSPPPSGETLDVEFHEVAPHDTQKSF